MWKYVACIAMFLVGLAGWFWFRIGDSQILGGLAGASKATDWGLATLGYGMTLAGVILGTGFRCAKDLKQKGIAIIDNLQTFVSGIIRSTDLWMGFFAAPIVAGFVFTTASAVETFGFALIALQNGFFCQGVIERLQVQEKASH